MEDARAPKAEIVTEVIVEAAEMAVAAGLVKGKADAKVDRVAADTRQDASVKQADARKDANADKRDADYKVAIEKCDALAGSAKDACISNAKVQYGKP